MSFVELFNVKIIINVNDFELKKSNDERENSIGSKLEEIDHSVNPEQIAKILNK
jgi:hypothetical protein